MTDIESWQDYVSLTYLRDMQAPVFLFQNHESWNDYVYQTYLSDLNADVFLSYNSPSILQIKSFDLDFICTQFDRLTI